ncbi:MAG: hypothetical protein OET90_11670, partial [Desulfuromonadales bacterium]|nr:hypothetical protein [Desulfuromonadales bacterium]
MEKIDLLLQRFSPYLLFVLFLALFCLLVKPLADIDLWWHLATGRHLLETKAFLTNDPFGLAGDAITPGREIILNSYWLAQLFFYLAHRLFDDKGLVLLRAVILSLPALCVILHYRRHKLESAAALLVAGLVGWGMLSVSGFRPNHLTVAFIPLLLMLMHSVGYVEDERDYNLHRAAILPFFMLIWANLHGGFILGVALLGGYLVCESLTHVIRRNPLRPLVSLWGVVVLSMLLTLATPNGWTVYLQLFGFEGSAIQKKTSEYLSPFVLAQNGVLVYWPYFIFLAICLIVLLLKLRTPSTKWLLALALLLISLSAFRYAPLFLGGAAILLASEISQLCRRFSFVRTGASLCAVALVLLLAISAAPHSVAQAKSALNQPVDANRFPVKAVDFLLERPLRGNTFNHFNWGGYLAWRAPGRLVPFIDGRSLNTDLFTLYTRGLWIPQEAQSIFDKHQVDVLLLPRLNPFTGELYLLTDFLWKSRNWAFVYRDESS